MHNEFEFSEIALANRSLFFNNTINIYVEDADSQYIYENIFQRLLEGKYRIESIFPQKGKLNVLKEYIKLGEYDENGVLNIFLVDGDFDRYLGFEEITRKECLKKKISSEDELKAYLKGKIINEDAVIYLKTYNIENYYIDENALTSIVQGETGKMIEESKNLLNFNYWRNRIVNEAKDLFLLYCFIQRYLNLNASFNNGEGSRLSIKNVSESPFRFLDEMTGFKSSTRDRVGKLREIINESLVDENPTIVLDTEIIKIKKVYEEHNGDDYYNLICGKFLLSSIFSYIQSICDTSLDFKRQKWQLIQNFDINKLSYIKKQIELLKQKQDYK
jgi:hypothetical protein